MVAGHQRLAQHWRQSGAGFVPAASDEAVIAAFERAHGLQLPDEFRSYLRFACPSDTNAVLMEPFTDWWPLSRITTVRDEYEHRVKNAEIVGREHEYVVFADAYLWCWAWAVACTTDRNRGRVAVLDGQTDRFVASSFDEFIDRYISDPKQVGP
jgi:hypothetical protein